MEHRMFNTIEFVSRSEARRTYLKVSAMQYYRYEELGLLTPFKAGGLRSARVWYRITQLEALMRARLPKPPSDDDVS